MRCGLPSTMGDMKCRNEHTWAAQQAELPIDSYQMASYLKEVTSRAQLRRLAQLRTGSHQLRVETGRWERPRVAREQRICQRCLSGEVDDEHHMVFDCPALEEVRVPCWLVCRLGRSSVFLSAGVVAGGCLCVCGF